MGIRISHLRNNVRPVSMDFGDGLVCSLSYRPMAMTATTQDEFEQMLADDKYTNALLAYLPQVIASWDLQNDDESAYPITTEAMRELPIEFLRRCLTTIMADLYPNQKSAAG